MEHRDHARSNLRLPVYLLQAGCVEPIQTQTENVSKDGFFVFVDCPLMPGDTLRFLLLLPEVSEMAPGAARVSLYGELQVIRACADLSQDRFGIGCRLTSYRVLPDSGEMFAEDLVRKVLNPIVGAA